MFLIFSLGNIVSGQGREFVWQDSLFNIGDKKIVELNFNYGGACTMSLCYDFMDNGPVIDSIITFMRTNPSLHIEIGSHVDQRGSEELKRDLTEIRAKAIKRKLLTYGGIALERVASKGYGSSLPIVPEEIINEMEGKEEQELTYRRNRRIELIIVKCK